MKKRTLLSILVSCLLGPLAAVQAHAAVITVNAGGDLQSALNSAQPGDTILLQAGATFVGNFTLPVKSGTSYVTVRSSAADSNFPAAGLRIDPRYASLLPKLKSPNTSSALKTVTGTHHWRLQFLEFQANAGGYGEIVRLGSSSEIVAANQPHDLVFDRVYVHGDSRLGSKRGIALNSGNTTIVNSYFSDIKAAGIDAQAICGWNGPGPYAIENNYIEAAGENLLFGGADPAIPTLVPANITIRRNHFSKNLAWRNPIVGKPSGVTAMALSGGGLPAGTYAYRVIAYASCGNGVTCRSSASTEVTVTVGSAGAATLKWTAVPGASSYRIYGRSAGSENQYWTTSTTTFTDAGNAGAAAAVPTSAGQKWTVKNLLELKNARLVTIEGNLLEYCWQQDQKGYAVLFTPWNNGTAAWTVVRDVTFRFNTVQHVGAGIQINGHDTTHGSEYSQNIVVQNNLFTDVNATNWGGPGGFAVVGNGTIDVQIDHNTIVHTGFVVNGTGQANVGFVFTNNMAKHNQWGIYGDYHGAGWDSINVYFPGIDMRRNVLAGASASKYPTDNFFPAASEFLAQFVNAAGGDYHLATTSAYNNGGTDGTDVGANIDRLRAAQQ